MAELAQRLGRGCNHKIFRAALGLFRSTYYDIISVLWVKILNDFKNSPPGWLQYCLAILSNILIFWSF